MAALALLVFVPEGNRLSYHTILHAGITAQIYAGVVPPENPALAGEALEFYWLYHWLLAVYARLTGFSVLVSAPWIDIVSIGVYVGASYGLARRWLEPAPAALAAIAVGFAGNLFFPHEGDPRPSGGVQRSIESIIFHHADFVDFDIAKYLGAQAASR